MNKVFAICVLLFSICARTAGADDATDTARAAKRGVTAIAVGVADSRQPVASKRAENGPAPSGRQSALVSRQSITTGRAGPASAGGASQSEAGKAPTGEGRPTNARASGESVIPRAANTQTQRISERGGQSRSAVNQSRSAVASRQATSAGTRPVTQSRSAATSRAAVQNEAAAAIIKKDYKKCREIYYQCMDEFCANKDTQLKRCACSSRTHDFDSAKARLAKIEDQMLDFNERLLTVNMDKEDAAAISIATEGELAYAQDDKSKSKQILEEISKKLKSSTADNNLSKNLSAISLSLDMDAAFDNIDSLMGAGATLKEGTALYGAALPVCRDMVAELCDADAASLAESGYQLLIEQDCNTVAKTYDTMYETAKEKVREGSALLDMSRLDIYQTRNSDDILSCKKKMLNMLSSSAVCGTDLDKCLDTTGKYIDPSTGEAFLTANLGNLDKLITRPTGDQKWSAASGNEKFVSFLNDKKQYLEPAMENCQDIADQVWRDFIEDALAQIKIAQGRKLENVRQSCTTLTTQCLSKSYTSISEFDARALSIFGVSANKTVNEMCANVKTSCTALLQTTGGGTEWNTGFTEIETDKTYETIISTCREVGRACIIQNCKSISGNFGLCEGIYKSTNRKSIVSRTACWNDVVQCVASAGTTSISRIMTRYGKNPTPTSGDFYLENYGSAGTRTNDGSGCTDSGCLNIFDICDKCGTSGNPDCGTCRLAEKIWGNCEFTYDKIFTKYDAHNMIQARTGVDTLMSWFATNTGTAEELNSCTGTDCPAGRILINGFCINETAITTDKLECVDESKLDIADGMTNCCKPGERDDFNNCCNANPVSVPGINITGATASYYNRTTSSEAKNKICSSGNAVFTAAFNIVGNNGYYKEKVNSLVCVGGTLNTSPEWSAGQASDTSAGFPNGRQVKCTGTYVVINNDTGVYSSPEYKCTGNNCAIGSTSTYRSSPVNYYNLDSSVSPVISCALNTQTGAWTSSNGASSCSWIGGWPNSNDNNLFIKY